MHAKNGDWVRLFRILEEVGALNLLSEDCGRMAGFMRLWPHMKANTEWQNQETSETSRAVFTLLLDHLMGVHFIHFMVPNVPDDIFTQAMADEMAAFYVDVTDSLFIIDAGSVN